MGPIERITRRLEAIDDVLFTYLFGPRAGDGSSTERPGSDRRQGPRDSDKSAGSAAAFPAGVLW